MPSHHPPQSAPPPPSRPSLICALPTLFFPSKSSKRSDGTALIDYESLQELISSLCAQGIGAFLPAGSTGEALSLRNEERLEMVQFVADLLSKETLEPSVYGSEQPQGQRQRQQHELWAGIFYPSLEPALELLCHYNKIDRIDKILVITPYYIKPNPSELLYYFSALAEQTKKPLYLYNNPSRTGVDLWQEGDEEPSSLLSQLADLPSIHGIKESALSRARQNSLMALKKGRFEVYCGHDDLMEQAFSHGAHGAISALSSLLPSSLQLLSSGQATTSFKQELQKLLEDLCRFPNPQLLKQLLAKKEGFSSLLRAPLMPTPLSPQEEQLLLARIEQKERAAREQDKSLLTPPLQPTTTPLC